jgi:zinc transporter ZupT
MSLTQLGCYAEMVAREAVRRSGLRTRQVLPLAFASDTLSIGAMEVIDSLIVIFIPGAGSCRTVAKAQSRFRAPKTPDLPPQRRAGNRGVEPRVAVLETAVLPIHQFPEGSAL